MDKIDIWLNTEEENVWKTLTRSVSCSTFNLPLNSFFPQDLDLRLKQRFGINSKYPIFAYFFDYCYGSYYGHCDGSQQQSLASFYHSYYCCEEKKKKDDKKRFLFRYPINRQGIDYVRNLMFNNKKKEKKQEEGDFFLSFFSLSILQDYSVQVCEYQKKYPISRNQGHLQNHKKFLKKIDSFGHVTDSVLARFLLFFTKYISFHSLCNSLRKSIKYFLNTNKILFLEQNKDSNLWFIWFHTGEAQISSQEWLTLLFWNELKDVPWKDYINCQRINILSEYLTMNSSNENQMTTHIVLIHDIEFSGFFSHIRIDFFNYQRMLAKIHAKIHFHVIIPYFSLVAMESVENLNGLYQITLYPIYRIESIQDLFLTQKHIFQNWSVHNSNFNQLIFDEDNRH